jgi:hypothetical protein
MSCGRTEIGGGGSRTCGQVSPVGTVSSGDPPAELGIAVSTVLLGAGHHPRQRQEVDQADADDGPAQLYCASGPNDDCPVARSFVREGGGTPRFTVEMNGQRIFRITGMTFSGDG